MEAFIGFLFFVFIIGSITSNAAPALKQKGDEDTKIDYASELRRIKEREIALAKQKAWQQKGGKL
jgi:hypothetical protein